MSIANMIVRSANTKEIARITRLFQFAEDMVSSLKRCLEAGAVDS